MAKEYCNRRKKSKHVWSWFVHEDANGVYHLTFNLSGKDLSFHAYSDTEFYFGEGREDETLEEHDKCVHEIEPFLPQTEGRMFLRGSQRNKDQVTFYYIPFDKNWIKEGKYRLVKSGF